MAGLAKAIPAKPRTANNGGTSAPRGAAQGVFPKTQLTGQWNPKPGAESKKTAYAQGAGQAPGAAPPPSANPYAPAPWDSQYELSRAGANSKYDKTMIDLSLKKSGIESEYGLSPGFNDYQTNPYSRAAVLERSYQRSNRGTANSSASTGQLYAGSTQNALGYNRDARDQESDSLNRSYLSSLQANSDEGVAALNAREDERNEAGWKRVEHAGEEPLDPTTSPEGARKPKGKQKKAGNRQSTIHVAVSNARSLGGKKKKK